MYLNLKILKPLEEKKLEYDLALTNLKNTPYLIYKNFHIFELQINKNYSPLTLNLYFIHLRDYILNIFLPFNIVANGEFKIHNILLIVNDNNLLYFYNNELCYKLNVRNKSN